MKVEEPWMRCPMCHSWEDGVWCGFTRKQVSCSPASFTECEKNDCLFVMIYHKQDLKKRCKEFDLARETMGLTLVLANDCLGKLAEEVDKIEELCDEVVKENLVRW